MIRLLIIILAIGSSHSITLAMEKFKFYQSYYNYPDSYDPLDADLSRNMSLMKLRFLAPIELDHKDHFRSTLLKSFLYDANSTSMTWVVADKLFYSDGTKITVDDIVLSLKRMAMARPEFPVLGDIVGLKSWGNLKTPLKETIPGIKVIGNRIVIKFKEKVANPFFQFTLPIFSVIPSRCIDLESSKMICKSPPASGYYDSLEPILLAKSSKNKIPNSIDVQLRKGFDFVHGKKMPHGISLVYVKSKSLTHLFGKTDINSVIETNNELLSDKFINYFRKSLYIKRMPLTASRYILLNPNFRPLNQKSCRRIFADKFREIYAKEKFSSGYYSASFSSPIMPGYLNNKTLHEQNPISKESRNNCTKLFSKSNVDYRIITPEKDMIWDRVTKKTYKALGIRDSNLKRSSRLVNAKQAFLDNETSVIPRFVSFWPLDLEAGFKMFFTPGMHAHLKHSIADGVVTQLSDQIFRETDPIKKKELFKQINLHLYDQAYLNSIGHFGVVFISKNPAIEKTIISTGEPNPWHLFKID